MVGQIPARGPHQQHEIGEEHEGIDAPGRVAGRIEALGQLGQPVDVGPVPRPEEPTAQHPFDRLDHHRVLRRGHASPRRHHAVRPVDPVGQAFEAVALQLDRLLVGRLLGVEHRCIRNKSLASLKLGVAGNWPAQRRTPLRWGLPARDLQRSQGLHGSGTVWLRQHRRGAPLDPTLAGTRRQVRRRVARRLARLPRRRPGGARECRRRFAGGSAGGAREHHQRFVSRARAGVGAGQRRRRWLRPGAPAPALGLGDRDDGVQLGLFAYARSFQGVQLGVAGRNTRQAPDAGASAGNRQRGDHRSRREGGAQLGGQKGHVEGAQLGVLWNEADIVEGGAARTFQRQHLGMGRRLRIGVLNFAGQLRGAQLGAINVVLSLEPSPASTSKACSWGSSSTAPTSSRGRSSDLSTSRDRSAGFSSGSSTTRRIFEVSKSARSTSRSSRAHPLLARAERWMGHLSPPQTIALSQGTRVASTEAKSCVPPSRSRGSFAVTRNSEHLFLDRRGPRRASLRP